ncbi:transglutaminase [Fibrella sp. HMF5335]|uniref:Transglutaminase n=1 Tax=Fibrella rubiginis TaxID=2817060 RepID=A0A939GNU8_9BACT|nr:transglutaminase [Fibrella rubiginis]MBO0939888.1 transglutaminase [Fibrella rubiginis]
MTHLLPALFSLALSLMPLISWSQAAVKPPEVRFGQVTVADFALKPVPNDTTAEAVVLYESVETEFELGSYINMVSTYFSRIRINKKSGYGQATLTVELGNSGKIRRLEGMTYLLKDGQIVRNKMDKDAIQIEEVTDDNHIQKFTLPGVEEGCIIEYRYTWVSPQARTLSSWNFQHSIPVIWSDFKATVSNYYFQQAILTGYLPLTINEAKPSSVSLRSEGSWQLHFAMANVPAFRDEPFITTPRDYMARVEFELASATASGVRSKKYFGNWEDVDNKLLKSDYFVDQYKKAPYFRGVASNIMNEVSANDTLARVKAAYEFVRTTMTWNERCSLYSMQLKKVLDLKKGDVADLNFMLIGLLRDLGLVANPLILSTRNHGHVDEDVGLLRNFNYVVAHLTLGGKDFVLDATDRFVKPGMLPLRALNGSGRLILPDGKSRFVSLTPTERNTRTESALLTLSTTGELTGTMSYAYGGYGDVEARRSVAVLGREKLLEEVKHMKPAWQIEKIDISDFTDNKLPLTIDYVLTLPEGAQVAGDRMYFQPLLTEGISKNPFKQPERQFPVDFAVPSDETFMATYTLPNGYTVEELPKPLALSLPNNGGRFNYQVQQQGNQLLVVSRISIRKPVFPANEYVLLKEFYEKILLKHGEQIVLKKGATLAEKK